MLRNVTHCNIGCYGGRTGRASLHIKLAKHSAMKKIRYIALLLSMAIAAAALSASAATKQFTLAFDENDFRFSTNEYGELVSHPSYLQDLRLKKKRN